MMIASKKSHLTVGPARSWLLVLFAFVTVGTAEDSQWAWLHGRVLDWQDAVIPGIKVRVSSEKYSCDTSSDDKGQFNCKLRPGYYHLTAESFNTLPYRRAGVQLNAADHKYLVVRPVFAAPSDQMAIPNPKLQYEVRTVQDLEVVVQFEKSAHSGNTQTFSGDHLMLSASTLAIYAKEISCTASMERCTANGPVLAELGNDQVRGTRIDLDLSHRQLTLTRAPTVSITF